MNLDEITTLLNLGLNLQKQGKLQEARSVYEQVLIIQPQQFDALHLLGVICFQEKNSEDAIKLILKATEFNPNDASAYSNLGAAYADRNLPEKALECYEKAILIKTDYADAYYNRGNTLSDLKRFNEAIVSYEKAISINQLHARAYFNRGNALVELKRPIESIESYRKAIQILPNYPEALNNLGQALKDSNELTAALENFNAAIELKENYAEAYYNKADTLSALNRLHEAIPIYDIAVKFKKDYYDAHNNKGNALKVLKRFQGALLCYEQAIQLKPDFVEAWVNKGNVFKDLKQFKEALQCYQKAFEIIPKIEFLAGIRLHVKQLACDWHDLEIEIDLLERSVDQYEKTVVPFTLLAMTDRPDLHLKASEIFKSTKFPLTLKSPTFVSNKVDEKIRIGYYSADFHNHATSYLMAELFESHNTDKFEIFGFSFGPNVEDEMRHRLKKAFHQFTDVSFSSDQEVGLISRKLGINIALDLKGYTQDCRPGIFAQRCAPLQVNFLGYPGSMGAEYIDYLIADKHVVPIEGQSYYSEKIVYLPNSYQVNDSNRVISNREFTREELGLPAHGFIYCCFNNNFKILPNMFDIWVTILKEVENSTLWLLEDNPLASKNLRIEAEKRGLNSDRIVFAQRMEFTDHLARHKLADLFLDTFPYNAHTTASDALWAGLPLLTLQGKSFASRVASSLLQNLGLAELITKSITDYERKAIELGRNSEMLCKFKNQLITNRLSSPLFDGKLFAADLESAFEQMYSRLTLNQSPEHIIVKK